MTCEIIIFVEQGITLLLSALSIIYIIILDKKLRKAGYVKALSSLFIISIGLAMTTCNIWKELVQMKVLKRDSPGFVAGLLITFTYSGRYLEKTELCYYPLKYLAVLLGNNEADSIFRAFKCFTASQSRIIFYSITATLIVAVISCGWLDSYFEGLEEFISQFGTIVLFLLICTILQFCGIVPLVKIAHISNEAKVGQILLTISSVIQSILQIVVNGMNLLTVIYHDHPLYEDETYLVRNIISIVMRLSTIVVLIMVLVVTKQVQTGLIQAQKTLAKVQKYNV